MTDNPAEFDRDAWSHYWETTDSDGVGAVRGEQQAKALNAWWSARFDEVFAENPPTSLLDMACGAAVVARVAKNRPDAAKLNCVCTDYSPGALVSARQGLGSDLVTYCAADARKSPFADAGFDLVVSQYGLEYGGENAFGEAARLVAPGGHMLALVHTRGGGIDTECATNLAVLSMAIEEDIIGQTARLLKSAETSDGEETRALEREFEACFERIGAALTKSGPGRAYDYVVRLANDLAQIYNRRANHMPHELANWLDVKNGELEAFQIRMRTMTNAAMDETEIDSIKALMAEAGLKDVSASKLVFESEKASSAWAITARAAN
jgi:ubiquinone/menaquinone biosynthesis C-methylase UbiE